MPRPRRPVKVKSSKKARKDKSLLPADSYVKDWILMRESQPERFEKMVKERAHLRMLIENFERVTK